MKELIDISKCIGCHQGERLFIKKDNKYYHINLFNNSLYLCNNSEIIDKYLIKNKNKGTYLPNNELKEFYMSQDIWWMDIKNLSYEIFKDWNAIDKFWNNNELILKTMKEIENILICLAKQKNVIINEENYSNLIIWQNT